MPKANFNICILAGLASFSGLVKAETPFRSLGTSPIEASFHGCGICGTFETKCVANLRCSGGSACVPSKLSFTLHEIWWMGDVDLENSTADVLRHHNNTDVLAVEIDGNHIQVESQSEPFLWSLDGITYSLNYSPDGTLEPSTQSKPFILTTKSVSQGKGSRRDVVHAYLGQCSR